MPAHDISTRDALNLLSVRDDGPSAHSRRKFLQMVGWGVAGSAALSAVDDRLGVVRKALAATPTPPNDGILILLGMHGGNDGLNTLIPFGTPQYYSYRSNISIPANSTLQLNSSVGLHPNLAYLKSLWDQQNVAVVQGVGYPNPNLSHFDSMATWMKGSALAGLPTTGWIGRWLDGVGGAPSNFTAATIDNQLPLHMIGAGRRGTSVPEGGYGFGGGTSAEDQRLNSAMRQFAAASGGRGQWHDLTATTQRDQIDAAQTVAPLFSAALPTGRLARRMTVAARLINANLGMRVIDTSYYDFDFHSGEAESHGNRMTELNTALQAFYAAVSPAMRSRVTIMTYSEFGRTPWSNGSGGTDHGTANVQFVIGDRVKGGLYGTAPSLLKTNGQPLAQWDRMVATTDFRQLYATMIDGVLGGGSSTVLQGTFDKLDLFKPIADVPPPTPAPTTTAPTVPTPSTVPSSTLPPIVTTPTTAPAVIAPPPSGTPRRGTGSDFAGIVPRRLLDTRTTGSPLGAAQSITLKVGGVGEIPAGATAAVLNVTAVEATKRSYLTVWPTGSAQPNTSTLNVNGGDVVPNLTTVKLGADGSIDIFNDAGVVHCIVDVVGYFVTGSASRFTSLPPTRALDTRTGQGAPLGPVGPAGSIDLQIGGTGGVAPDATAVVMNVTVTGPTANGYVSVWPTGTEMPTASNLNFVPGQTVPNLVVAKVGAGGRVSFFNSAGSTDILADVLGYFSPGGTDGLVPLDPVRLLDTRTDGGSVGGTPRVLAVTGRAGVPAAGVSAVVLNVTYTAASANGYVTVFPNGGTPPLASNLNTGTGDTRANLVICKVGTDGAVGLFNSSGSVHLIVDVVGYFAT